jgi:hypothetical protein
MEVWGTYIALSFLMTSSMTSKLAFAIICITWRSCPAPILTLPPCPWDVLDAPERAVNVPAKADVDQLGRFAERGEETEGTGLLE